MHLALMIAVHLPQRVKEELLEISNTSTTTSESSRCVSRKVTHTASFAML